MRACLVLFLAVSPVLAQVYRVEPVAGTGQEGLSGDGGPAREAALSAPGALALDRAGRLLIADTGNGRVRRVDEDRTIRTIAAELGAIRDLAVDASNRVYAAVGPEIRVVFPDGRVETLAVQEATFENITALASAWDGTLFVADGARVLRIGPDRVAAPVQTGIEAPVTDLAVGPDGSVFLLADRVYRLATSGVVTPLDAAVPIDENSRIAVDAFGQAHVSGAQIWRVAGATATALMPVEGGATGIAIDTVGTVFFAEPGVHRVRALELSAISPPVVIYPADRALEMWPGLTLQWTPVPRATSYEVLLGTQADRLEPAGRSESPFLTPAGLRGLTTYFWRVVVRAGSQTIAASPVWTFTTAAAGRPPDSPRNPSPGNFAMGQLGSTILTWTGPAASRFEVYFGETNTPGRVAVVEGNRHRVDQLRPETTYFWRVVAFNDSGAASSPVWQFTTGPAAGYPFVIATIGGTALPTGDGIDPKAAVLELPRRPAVDSVGQVHFIDGGRRVRRIGNDGRLTTVFTPTTGTVSALAADSAGNLLIAMPEYLLRVNRQGQRSFVAGQPGRRGYAGDGGNGLQALFDGISSMAVDRARNVIYVADSRNGRIRSISSAGIVQTVAESTAAEVAVDRSGNVYAYEPGRIVRLSGGVAEPIAAEAPVIADGGMTFDDTGNLYFADRQAMAIRRVDPQGVITTIAGEGGAGFSGDGLPAVRARLSFPDGLAVDPLGNVIVADWLNHRLRRIDTAGFIETIAGSDTAFGDRGSANSAYLFAPTDVAVDGGGTVYVADSYNGRIRRILVNRTMDTIAFGDLLAGGSVEVDDAGNVSFNDGGAIQTITGNGAPLSRIATRVPRIGGLARAPGGDFFVSDTLNHRVLRVAADGTLTTVAGTGEQGYSGEGGPATQARLNSPGALSVSPEGDLLIADFARVRRVGRDGNITTVANEHANGLAHDRLGRLYVTSNRFVYVLAAPGQLVRIAGREQLTGSDADVIALNGRIGEAGGIAVSPDGEIVFADSLDNRVRRLTRNIPAGIAIVSGQDQSAAVSTQLAQPVVVQVNGRAGLPVSGVTVRFVSADRGVSVTSSAVTNANGQISIRPTAGTRAGDFVVSVESAGLSPAEIRVRVTQ